MKATTCCSVTTPAAGAYPEQTVCATHEAAGWRVLPNQYRGKPGVDRIETYECGCVRTAINQQTISKCARHTIGLLACCEQASRSACVCADSYTCPIHGDRHYGTHE